MHRLFRNSGLAVAVLTVLAHLRANGASIVAGVTNFPIAAIQDVELLPGTPFNPPGSSIVITDLTPVGGGSIDRVAIDGL